MEAFYRSEKGLSRWVPRAQFASGIGRATCLLEWLSPFFSENRPLVVVSGAGLASRQSPASELLQTLLKSSAEFHHLTLAGEPSDLWVDEAKSLVCDAAAVISIGGGSALDAGKALAVMLEEPGKTKDFLEGVGTKKPSGRMRPWFAVPTTAGTGSEATTNAVLGRIGKESFKKSLRHKDFAATGVILDGRMLEGIPSAIAAASGLDALTQLLESYLSVQANTELDPWLEDAILQVLRWLPILVNQSTEEARQAMLESAFLSGVGLSRNGLGTVHGLAGPMGAISRVSHGLACAQMLGPAWEETVRWMQEHSEETSCAVALKKLEKLVRAEPKNAGVSNEVLQIFLGQIVPLADDFRLPKLGNFGIGNAEIEAVISMGNDRNSPARLGHEVWRKILLSAVG